MSDNSKIEWTDATLSTVRGCKKISPGCKHCYAETFAERFRGVPGHPFEQGFDIRLVPEALAIPLRWQKPRTIFVNSMADTFHEDVPEAYIGRIFQSMNAADWHTYQVLTKRAERMSNVVAALPADLQELEHVWLGVSVEDRKHGVPRIEHLRTTPAAVRFLSIEPLLEDLGELDLRGIDWVIIGGESGRKARPMHPDWVRSLIRQCVAAGVRVFFKQFGEWGPSAVNMLTEHPVFRSFANKTEWINKASTWMGPRDRCIDTAGKVLTRGSDFEAAAYPVAIVRKLGKHKAGRIIDGQTWDEMPEIAVRKAPPLAERQVRAGRLGLEYGRGNRALPILGNELT